MVTLADMKKMSAAELKTLQGQLNTVQYGGKKELSVKEAQSLTGMGEMKIKECCRLKEIKARKIGGRWSISRVSLLAYAKGRKTTGRASRAKLQIIIPISELKGLLSWK